MYFKSKRISLLILGLTAILCSRAMFVFIDDPEGPNLLVVMVMAAIIYSLSLPIYLYTPGAQSFLRAYLSLTGFKRLLFVVLIQILIAAAFYFLSELETHLRT